MKNKFLLLLIITSFYTLAETHISGEIKSEFLDSTGNPYIVEQDIVVPAGKKLTIKEGCIFLFKPFTGLNVYGQIKVSGSSKQPVVFTTLNDKEYNKNSDQIPNPFDWNGILIAKESQPCVLENFYLRYSVYGIKAQTTNVIIKNGLFRQNGQFHFTVNEKIQYVQDNIPFSYSGQNLESGKNISEISEVKINKKKDKSSDKSTIIFRYTSLGIGVVGIAAGAIMLIPWNSARTELSLPQDEFEMKYRSDPNAKWLELNSKKNGFGWGSAISFIMGGIGIIGFSVSFAF
jgi:hypothetical protein